jgi:hypothetical protein
MMDDGMMDARSLLLFAAQFCHLPSAIIDKQASKA